MAGVINVYTTSATTENMSRNEYLLWVNFTDFLFPGTMQMKRVKWNSRLELDWLSNWKLVQTAWKQVGVDKVIPVEKLIKGKFQDNFEFLQWFKKFFDANYDGHEYNPLEARNFEELPTENKAKPGGGGPLPGKSLRAPQQKAAPTVRSSAAPQRTNSNASVNSSGNASAGSRPSAGKLSASSAQPARNHHPPQQKLSAPTTRAAPAPAAANDSHLFEELKQLKAELEDCRLQLGQSDELVAGLEKERDFYFTKLRKIEVICQDNEPAGVVEVPKLLEVLYETEEGFAPPEEVEEGLNGDGEGNGEY